MTLFTPLQLGNTVLAHRLALAPMTRYRIGDDHIPLPIVAEYYAQRAAVPGTLLITEATLISPRAGGYAHVPGIWSAAQITAWRAVTEAVHKKGSFIYMQLWALGRTADPLILKAEGGRHLVSSSAVPITEGADLPLILSDDDIWAFVGDFAQAAKNAIDAGFDGVEVHGANGYLVDQFTQDTVNHRTDQWGGSIENRSRFAVEVVKAIVDAVGAQRTAVRFSPFSTYQGMGMELPRAKEQFANLAQQMAYVHLLEARILGAADTNVADEDEQTLSFFLEPYKAFGGGPVIIAGGYTGQSAKEAVEGRYKGYDVVIGIGRPWTANPDLVFRIKEDLPLRPYEREHFYTVREPKGYADYKFSEEYRATTAAAAA
ncbi:unnamed protein product [Penicillium pancosmium]